MSRPVSEEDDDLLDVPHASDVDDEGTGVEDAEELLFSELDDAPEEVGLDVESIASSEGLPALNDLDDEDEDGSEQDETPLEIDDEIDADGDEEGWTDEAEASATGWDDELPDDLSEDVDTDGGEEGVEDPLLDGLPEGQDLPPVDDEDDEEETVAHDEWDDELPVGIRQDA